MDRDAVVAVTVCGAVDPSVDLVLVWSFLPPQGRDEFLAPRVRELVQQYFGRPALTTVNPASADLRVDLRAFGGGATLTAGCGSQADWR